MADAILAQAPVDHRLFPALHTLREMLPNAKQVAKSAKQVALWATAEAGSQPAVCSWDDSSPVEGSGALLAAAVLIVFMLGFLVGAAVTSCGSPGRCNKRDAAAGSRVLMQTASTQLDWDWK